MDTITTTTMMTMMRTCIETLMPGARRADWLFKTLTLTNALILDEFSTIFLLRRKGKINPPLIWFENDLTFDTIAMRNAPRPHPLPVPPALTLSAAPARRLVAKALPAVPFPILLDLPPLAAARAPRVVGFKSERCIFGTMVLALTMENFADSTTLRIPRLSK